MPTIVQGKGHSCKGIFGSHEIVIALILERLFMVEYQIICQLHHSK